MPVTSKGVRLASSWWLLGGMSHPKCIKAKTKRTKKDGKMHSSLKTNGSIIASNPFICEMQAQKILKAQPFFAMLVSLNKRQSPQSQPLFWDLRPPEELLKKLPEGPIAPEWFRPKTKRPKRRNTEKKTCGTQANPATFSDTRSLPPKKIYTINPSNLKKKTSPVSAV